MKSLTTDLTNVNGHRHIGVKPGTQVSNIVERLVESPTVMESIAIFDNWWREPTIKNLVFYSSKLFEILKFHLPTAHAYVDDTQLYLSFIPAVSTNETDAISAVENCICDIRQWMLEDRLMLNDNKTEVLLTGTLKPLPSTSMESIKFDEVNVKLVNTARNLGTCFDTSVTMNMNINKTCCTAFFLSI